VVICQSYKQVIFCRRLPRLSLSINEGTEDAKPEFLDALPNVGGHFSILQTCYVLQKATRLPQSINEDTEDAEPEFLHILPSAYQVGGYFSTIYFAEDYQGYHSL
jgi:hypothetical protein